MGAKDRPTSIANFQEHEALNAKLGQGGYVYFETSSGAKTANETDGPYMAIQGLTLDDGGDPDTTQAIVFAEGSGPGDLARHSETIVIPHGKIIYGAWYAIYVHNQNPGGSNGQDVIIYKG